MAFVCTARISGFRVEVLRAGTTSLAIINIGHDDTEPLNYSAVIGFDTLPGGGFELYLHIVEADGATGSEHLFWSGKETRFIADPADREAVLASILTGLKGLVSMCGPDGFSWFTYDEQPPKKALVKFKAFREVIERCGYVVTSSRLPAGRRAWKAKRAAPSTVDTEQGDTDPIDLRS